MPNPERINLFFQKNITRSLPVSNETLLEKIATTRMHLDNFSRYYIGKGIDKCNYFEFGTGYDLFIPIIVSLHGFGNLKCIDIRNLAFPEIVNDLLRRLDRQKLSFNLLHPIPEKVPNFDIGNIRKLLKDIFRIEYIAPLDARDTGFESDSIDFVLSNATMEHIPADTIRGILNECYRIMTPGGIMSNAIDYRDHFSFSDTSITSYNYLKYSEKQWKILNPSIMYQNRLRHKDYIKLFKDSGFEILKISPDYPTEEEFAALRSMKLDKKYTTNYSPEELSIKSATIVVKKS